MNVSTKIENEINEVKDFNQEAGNLLHEQLHHASNAQWSNDELSELIKSENDAVDMLDIELLSFDEHQAIIRNIQDSIISTFSE